MFSHPVDKEKTGDIESKFRDLSVNFLLIMHFQILRTDVYTEANTDKRKENN